MEGEATPVKCAGRTYVVRCNEQLTADIARLLKFHLVAIERNRVNNVENVISQLETQRSAIDRALEALREVAGKSPLAAMRGNNGRRRKRHLSPEGRQRIIEATKKRWAAARANSASKGAASPRRGAMSAAGRKRLALAMKKRWAAAKKAGKKQLS